MRKGKERGGGRVERDGWLGGVEVSGTNTDGKVGFGTCSSFWHFKEGSSS